MRNAILVIGMVSLLGSGAWADDEVELAPSVVVAARKAGYDLQGAIMGDLKRAVDAHTEEVKPFKPNAEAIVAWAKVIPTLFPPGTEKNTKALPGVWSDRAGFEKAAAHLAAVAETLVKAADFERCRGVCQRVQGDGGGLRRLPPDLPREVNPAGEAGPARRTATKEAPVQRRWRGAPGFLAAVLAVPVFHQGMVRLLYANGRPRFRLTTSSRTVRCRCPADGPVLPGRAVRLYLRHRMAVAAAPAGLGAGPRSWHRVRAGRPVRGGAAQGEAGGVRLGA